MKNLFTPRRFVLRLATVALALLPFSAQSEPLDLADKPLFLGISTDPNVFFELDDSGSMDWSVLTAPYFHFCQYDRDAPGAGGSGDCVTSKMADGLWSSYGDNNYRTYRFMFDNADNLYNGCNGNATNVEGCGGFQTVLDNDWRGGSADFNVMYYSPFVDYRPWPGTGLADANFSSARSNPQPEIAAIAERQQTETEYYIPAQSRRWAQSGYSNTRNLSGFVYYVWVDSHGYSGDRPRRGSNINRTDGSNGEIDLWDNYYRYTVYGNDIRREKIEWSVTSWGNSKGRLTPSVTETVTFSGNSVEPNPPQGQPARSANEIRTNIANWYSYSRKRSYVAKSAIGTVVASSPAFRFGLSVLNKSDALFHDMPSADIYRYTGVNTQLLNDLYSFRWESYGTPLRNGLKMAGRYYKGEINNHPSPIVQSCQQNFTVLFTDGYWNGGDPGVGDADGNGRNNTVADVAKYYYDRDLSPLSNDVVPNASDPATHQHMVTFPVAFGLTGNLEDTDGDGWPNPELDENDEWGGDPFGSDLSKIDDLWHAAFNSKGEYVSAKTPEDVVNSLVSALSEISGRNASSASVATSTGQISSDTAVFQAQFNSGDWSGQLYSYSLNADDSVNVATPNWEASQVLDTQNFNTGRTIISHNGTRGIPFRFPGNYRSRGANEMSDWDLYFLMWDSAPYSLLTNDAGQIAANQQYGTDLINYLRGDRSNEGGNSGDLRPRTTVLGDIVASDPKYVGPPAFGYPDDLESASYDAFRTARANRAPMVYVGANDGMLHGFAAANGQEKLAYVPRPVFKNLHKLAESPYDHKYFVDAAPTVVDAFWNGAWHSVLVGALGHGGQGIFALDVTNPASFSEASASNIALWEFTDSNDSDMGFSYSEPSIAKMANGQWVAVFGNGYNNTENDLAISASGHAVLYIVDIATGALVKKIDTTVGDTTTPNGLASPALVDVNGDYVVDYIYAGDLRGNMWKFDVTDTSPNNWDVAWTSGGNKYPLFNAGIGHPITTRPAVGLHPTSAGQLVYFGTGKYIETHDNTADLQPDQSFYAIWDKNLDTGVSVAAVRRAQLLGQEITNEITTTIGGYNYDLRLTSDNPIDWSSHLGWYIDLVNRNASPVDNLGERQVTESLLRNGRIIFSTHVPSSAPCSPGGSSWLMELDAYTGGHLDEAPFDLDRNHVFDDADYDYNTPGVEDVPPGGLRPQEGIISSPGVLRDNNREVKYLSGSTGAISDFAESTGAQNIGRQSWRELE
ncbi:type IV pilus biogenesis protein [Teredinibacter turnerae T7901]|uniref:Type IV pilus biogenesis protein n=1 Tax=Teredinibacter turnerae (strain ATCC 39867 / T7901) TaxID=377629 RepID=C5BPS2_TERTT|nr:PilC/PilY family type IV pilus protein [Teredinibacter turnerae]ACR12933.1 type IV pilus biogenesis protein [Teredinibacter turnerae T7901]